VFPQRVHSEIKAPQQAKHPVAHLSQVLATVLTKVPLGQLREHVPAVRYNCPPAVENPHEVHLAAVTIQVKQLVEQGRQAKIVVSLYYPFEHTRTQGRVEE
jgi:hypothetical protein